MRDARSFILRFPSADCALALRFCNGLGRGIAEREQNALCLLFFPAGQFTNGGAEGLQPEIILAGGAVNAVECVKQ